MTAPLARLGVLVTTFTLVIAGLVAIVDGRSFTPAATRSVVIIGDSIVNGNKQGVQAALAARRVPSWHINSKSGRMITTSTVINGSVVTSGLSAVDEVGAAGVDSRLWVVELGTNNLGMIRRCGCNDRVAFALDLVSRMRETIGPDTRVAWVTVRANTMLPESIAINTALRQLADRDPGFTLIDWYDRAAGHPDWFADGVHPNLTGVAQFSDLLATSIAQILPSLDSITTTTTTTTSTTSTVAAVPTAADATATATRLTTTSAPTTVGRCGTISVVVAFGATGSAVRTVQCALVLAGFDPGPVDGVFGSRTRTAVTAFQVAQGLASTGAVDAATGVALGIR